METSRTLLQASYDYGRAAFHYAFPRQAFKRLTSTKWREEEIEMQLLPALVDPKREAIDVGANVGHYSVALSKLATLVHAFEPNPQLAYILKRNLPANVQVHATALSSHEGTATLTVPFFGGPVEGMATISENDFAFGKVTRLNRFRVNTTKLDDLSTRNVGFVKIDVEGHEIEVLAGARELIRLHKPIFLLEVEERHRFGSVAEVFEFFADLNYAGFFVFEKTLLPLSRFSVDFQDQARIVARQPRTSYNYINNFVFIPSEHWSPELEARLGDILSEATVVEHM